MEDLGYQAIWEQDLPLATEWLQQMKNRPAYTKAYYPGARYSEIFPNLGLGEPKGD